MEVNIIEEGIDVLIRVGELAQSESPDITDFQNQFSLEQKEALVSFANTLGIGLLAYSLFCISTIFWPALIVTQEISALNAYIESLKLFKTDFFRILMVGLLYLAVNLVLSLILSTSPIMMSLREEACKSRIFAAHDPSGSASGVLAVALVPVDRTA